MNGQKSSFKVRSGIIDLRIDYNNVVDTDFREELEILLDPYGSYGLPPYFYTRNELISNKVRRYELENFIRKEREQDNERPLYHYNSE